MRIYLVNNKNTVADMYQVLIMCIVLRALITSCILIITQTYVYYGCCSLDDGDTVMRMKLRDYITGPWSDLVSNFTCLPSQTFYYFWTFYSSYAALMIFCSIYLDSLIFGSAK